MKPEGITITLMRENIVATLNDGLSSCADENERESIAYRVLMDVSAVVIRKTQSSRVLAKFADTVNTPRGFESLVRRFQ